MEARYIYREKCSHDLNRFKKRKFVDGAVYTDLFDKCVQIIDPVTECKTVIRIFDEDTEQLTDVVITCNTNVNDLHLMNEIDLHTALNEHAPNTYRKILNDKGAMYIVGTGKKGDGSVGTYNLSNKSEKIKRNFHRVCKSSTQYYSHWGYEQDVHTMGNYNRERNGEMAEDYFVNSIVSSVNLTNASHNDINDGYVSICTWTEKYIGTAENWYFILPNTTIDGERGIAIKLKHGVTIRWDGRILFHCSMVGNVGSNNNVHGMYFGVQK